MEILKKLKKDRRNLIKAIQIVQKNKGYVSDDSIRNIANYFEIPIVEVEGVLSFYAQFKRTAPGKYQLTVCDGTACHVRNSQDIIDIITDELKIKDGETTKDNKFTLETVSCIGACGLAPVITVNKKVYGKMTPKKIKKVLKEYKGEVK
ncbi:MAG: NADH-quinone oxidoreductase subunit NuoE [Halanaerobiales bacterium]|nr:NADH-quinone oxidoreductase subunit NuoE [Halanaerobiales bacterium]